MPVRHPMICMLVLALMLPGCRAIDASAPAGRQTLVQTELYFGLARPDGADITDEQFDSFLRDEITPRFPQGLTVLTGRGQWREGDTLIREASRVVMILHPGTADAGAKIEAIRAAYKSRFNQTSVLRTDDRIHASF